MTFWSLPPTTLCPRAFPEGSRRVILVDRALCGQHTWVQAPDKGLSHHRQVLQPLAQPVFLFSAKMRMEIMEDNTELIILELLLDTRHCVKDPIHEPMKQIVLLSHFTNE